MSDNRNIIDNLGSYDVISTGIAPSLIPPEQKKKYPARYYEDQSYRELVDAIEAGLDDIKNGRVITEEEMREFLDELRGK